MARQERRRQLTGCIRRKAKRKVSSYKRVMHLGCGSVGCRYLLHQAALYHGRVAISALTTLPTLLLLCLLARIDDIAPNVPNPVAIATDGILCLQTTKFILNSHRYLRDLELDHYWYDIPLEEEENHAPYRMPRQNIRLNTWSEQECYENTSFDRVQLQRIYRCFGLADVAAQHNGYIRISDGHQDHRFHPEELFLFLMTKCKTGLSNKLLCRGYFGGHQSRWSYGWPWVLDFLDTRYAHIIGHEGLKRFVHQFPEFFDAIQRKVQRTRTHHFHDGTAEDILGLSFLPYDIFGFVDCSIDRILRPFSGPDGTYYYGAPRKEQYYRMQRAVYQRYIRGHGIKMETVLLPNGISTVYGPVSARAHDVADVLQMSRLDAFLVRLQEGRPHVYSVLGDHMYGANGLQCVRSYFRAYGGAQLTPYQERCNRAIKPCRLSIEHGYGALQDILFQLCADKRNYQLGKRHPYFDKQLRVCHLLQNIYNCLYGDKSSSYDMFNIMPPVLETYLRLVDPVN